MKWATCASLPCTAAFQDIEAFRTEIDQLRRHRRRREPSKDQLPLLPGEQADVDKDP